MTSTILLNIFPSVTSSRNDNKGSDKLDQDPGKILENIAVIADLIFNGIYEKGLSKNHRVKIQNISGDTSENVSNKVEIWLSNHT